MGYSMTLHESLGHNCIGMILLSCTLGSLVVSIGEIAPIDLQIANILTKALPRNRHQFFKTKLLLMDSHRTI